MTDPRPVPYPAATRAKGWRFELDMARFKASDTWLRAKSVRTRALCLFLWAEAWGQTPAGSLPNDDELIALMLDLEAAEFAAVKPILMRGWWLAEDGRLYHHVLVERVLEKLNDARSGPWRKWWDQVVATHGGMCVYCGCVPADSLDHVIPRSRGGADHPSNLVPACRPCNSSKGARTPEEWKR